MHLLHQVHCSPEDLLLPTRGAPSAVGVNAIKGLKEVTAFPPEIMASHCVDPSLGLLDECLPQA